MTKADIVNEIAKSTGVEKAQVQQIVESFMEAIKDSLTANKNVYLRGFGSFIVKHRAEKVARNISKIPPSPSRLTIFRHSNRPRALLAR